MKYTKLFEIVRESLPLFDSKEQNDLIKAEKILLLYRRSNSELLVSEIDDFIAYCKGESELLLNSQNLFTSKYDLIGYDENLIKFLGNEYFKLDIIHSLKHREYYDLYIDFAKEYESYILNYINKGIELSDWKNLLNLLKYYRFLLSDFVIENFTQALVDFIEVVIVSFKKEIDFEKICKEYPYILDKEFYLLINEFKDPHFEEYILRFIFNLQKLIENGESNFDLARKLLQTLVFYQTNNNLILSEINYLENVLKLNNSLLNISRNLEVAGQKSSNKNPEEESYYHSSEKFVPKTKKPFKYDFNIIETENNESSNGCTFVLILLKIIAFIVFLGLKFLK